MTMQLAAMLSGWTPQRDAEEWILGTVYKTEGSSYRKPGAMSLISSGGDQLGLLSGGCLEADIRLNARKVMASGVPVCIRYDGDDEDDLSYRLGIGCGGVVHVLLEPINTDNNYQGLLEIHNSLLNRRSGYFKQHIPAPGELSLSSEYVAESALTRKREKSRLDESNGETWLTSHITPAPHLLVAGGGIDAQPVVALANQLGWETTVWDPRPANARDEFFHMADHRLRCPVEELSQWVKDNAVNAAMLMTHSVPMDAQSLSAVADCGLDYVGLLGPTHRREEVFLEADLNDDEYQPRVDGPAGFDIGGELPESIALSVIAKCHDAIFGPASVGATANQE
jgi:xanthine dehydrogenase accessory factor